MLAGAAVGFAIGRLLGWLTFRLPNRAKLSRTGDGFVALGTTFLAYGLTEIVHGYGFVAVFVAALAIGDARLRQKQTIESFQTSISALAEIVAFVALGLTVNLASLGERHLWLKGFVLGAILMVVARPVAVMPILASLRVRLRERLLISWGGLKGAVPILLATLALLEGVPRAHDVYGIVFVVVALSVVVQGTTIAFVADRLKLTVTSAPASMRVSSRRQARGRQTGSVSSSDAGVTRCGSPPPAETT
jgi:cell volume regulation protein A